MVLEPVGCGLLCLVHSILIYHLRWLLYIYSHSALLRLLIVGRLGMTVWSSVLFYLHFLQLFLSYMWDCMLFYLLHSLFLTKMGTGHAVF